MISSAMIVLHDPHADVLQSGCISALKILTAARAILDLIYSVWSTSYDISLLDSFCSVRALLYANGGLIHLPLHTVLLVCCWQGPCALP